MALMSTVSSKGQVTIPQEVRENLGLKQGDKVEFVLEKGIVTLQPFHADENPFLEFVGALPMEQSTAEWIREIRDDIPGAMDY